MADERVSETVVTAVAEFKETDPVSLDPLYSVVDPEALDSLFTTNGLGVDRNPDRVAFTYCGCDVVVSADGSVHVSETA